MSEPTLPASKDLFAECTLDVEGGYICVRNSTGWMLACRKIQSAMQFDDLVAEAERNQKAWLEDARRG